MNVQVFFSGKPEGEMSRAASNLEILVKRKIASILVLLLGFIRVLLRAGHDARLLVVTHAFLEEVGLACQGDGLHEVERVGGIVVLLVAERDQEAVGHELDILLHQSRVHTEQRAGERVRQEFLLDGHGLCDYVLDSLLARAVLEMGEEQASKISMKTFVTGNKLVREGEAGHQSSLFEPEDGRKGAAEEDALNCGESDEALSEGRVLVLDPLYGPIGLLTDARD